MDVPMLCKHVSFISLSSITSSSEHLLHHLLLRTSPPSPPPQNISSITSSEHLPPLLRTSSPSPPPQNISPSPPPQNISSITSSSEHLLHHLLLRTSPIPLPTPTPSPSPPPQNISTPSSEHLLHHLLLRHLLFLLRTLSSPLRTSPPSPPPQNISSITSSSEHLLHHLLLRTSPPSPPPRTSPPSPPPQNISSITSSSEHLLHHLLRTSPPSPPPQNISSFFLFLSCSELETAVYCPASVFQTLPRSLSPSRHECMCTCVCLHTDPTLPSSTVFLRNGALTKTCSFLTKPSLPYVHSPRFIFTQAFSGVGAGHVFSTQAPVGICGGTLGYKFRSKGPMFCNDGGAWSFCCGEERDLQYTLHTTRGETKACEGFCFLVRGDRRPVRHGTTTQSSIELILKRNPAVWTEYSQWRGV
ncbi:hypothetical protein WMY93_028168 [Mugilogobius chulae]|uniref:Uncharacterized protein n=1 Tax=Mugilogobius chulae TaxID=88201 RepID=A0AAW0MYJ5_9GOBI